MSKIVWGKRPGRLYHSGGTTACFLPSYLSITTSFGCLGWMVASGNCFFRFFKAWLSSSSMYSLSRRASFAHRRSCRRRFCPPPVPPTVWFIVKKGGWVSRGMEGGRGG